MADLVGGAALGPVFDTLYKAVFYVARNTATFRSKFLSLQQILIDIQPVFSEIETLNKALDGREGEIDKLKNLLMKGEELVRKCSKTKWYDAWNLQKYSNDLTKLEKSLLKFFQIHGLIEVHRDNKKIRVVLKEHGKTLNEIHSMMRNMSLTGFSGWADVPEIRDSVVGFEVPLQESKLKLLDEKDDQVLVLSGPAGCGKTTLAAMVCQEEAIKAKYRGGIFFVTVTKTPNIKRIVGEIFVTKDNNVPEFASEEVAINQLNNLLTRSTSQTALLVLDDVWSESEFVIEKLRFRIPGKILVTSRVVFPKFNTYKLNLLSEKDAKAFFFTSAFKDGIPNVRLDLVHKIFCFEVSYLKPSMLNTSLETISTIFNLLAPPPSFKNPAASLLNNTGCEKLRRFSTGSKSCRPFIVWPAWVIWFRRVMMQSKRQILFPTENDLLRSLQASIDALDENVHCNRLRDCYLDLGSFPEDQRIHPAALLDMWVERYNLDEDDMSAMAIFFELSSQNMVNLALARKDAPGVVGLHNIHYIQQHDMLRELVIHQCDEKPVEERMRIYINIKGNDFPRWFKQRLQPLQAEVLSIITDKDFSSEWYYVQFPKVKVLVLNFETSTYNLPPFVGKIRQLKTLIMTNNGFLPAKLNNFQLCPLLNLKRINLERISVASIFTSNLQLPNLRKISLIMCEIGEAFENSAANIPYMWPKLVEMNIEYCNDLVEVPAEICDLVDLKRLSICYCPELVALPQELGWLANLEVLRLRSCTKLAELPESIVKLNRLGFLDVYDCVEMDCLPMEMDQLCSLSMPVPHNFGNSFTSLCRVRHTYGQTFS